MNRLLLISGSTRAASTNTALLRTATELVADATYYDGLSELPAFNPDDDHDPLPSPVGRLRAAIADADAVVFSTPEYAGALPGSFKNLLDWTVGGTEISAMPVAWANVAAPGRGDAALAELRTVLGYVGATIIEPACIRLFLDRTMIGTDGLIADADRRREILAWLGRITDHLT